MSSLNQTVISTAMPTVIHELGGFSFYSWVFTVYMLASTTTMPLYGKLADLFGRRKMILIGLALFLIGLILVGISLLASFFIGSARLVPKQRPGMQEGLSQEQF